MQTIWDKKRLIGSSTLTLGNFNLGEIGSNPNMGKPQGLLLNIGTNSYDGPSDGNGNQVVIRLMRARTSGNTAYHSIEIPVCGTRFLYDNGLSVCGFKWKQETSIAPLTVNTMIQSIHFVGDNVVCKEPLVLPLASGLWVTLFTTQVRHRTMPCGYTRQTAGKPDKNR